MKILILSSVLPCPAIDGQKLSIFNILKTFEDEDVSLLSFYSNKSEIELTVEEFPNLKIEGLVQSKAKMSNRIKAIFLNKPPAVYSGYSKEFAASLKSVLSKEKYDLIIFFSIGMLPYKKFAKNIPSIAAVSDALSEVYKKRQLTADSLLKRINGFINYKRLKNYEKKEYLKFDAIQIVSPIDAEILKTINPNNNICVIPIAVDDSYFKDRIKHKPLRISYCYNQADPNPYAGICEFVEKASKKFQQIEYEVHVLIGKSAPQNIVKNLNKYQNVMIYDYVETFSDFMLTSDIVIALDAIGTGLKNRVLQGMAAGACVVGTPVALAGFDYKNGIDAYCETDVDSILDRIHSLFQNPEEIEQTGLSARKFAKEKYSMDLYKAKWNTLAKKIIYKKTTVIGGKI